MEKDLLVQGKVSKVVVSTGGFPSASAELECWGMFVISAVAEKAAAAVDMNSLCQLT